ncbi:MAG TPA: NUDIX domain-containing protein [Candidatus Limnocylindria bacterium]|nr:NUDIX domain-containing protein [Candidatus Limnocylindria bacterium]
MSSALIRSAGMVLFYKKDHSIEYLLLHYPGGYWEFAKGKLEAGETKQMAAYREVQEETGLKADIKEGFCETITYIFKDRWGNRVNKEVYFFIGQATTQDIVLSHEHQGYAWLSFEKAITQLTYQNSKDVLMHADHFIREYNL